MWRAAALWLALCNPALADWTYIENWTEPLDGYETRAASTVNVDGFTLHLYRNPIGRVFALYTLPDGVGDLPGSGPIAAVTPEGFETKKIEARPEPGRVVEYARSTGRALRDRLWHGEGQAPMGTLKDILEAPAIHLEMTLASGEEIEATWSMEGSGLPIAQALGLTIEGIPAGAEWEDAASQAMLAAMTACQFPSLDMACVQRVTACSTQISEARDIDGFEACVADGG